MVKLDVFKLNGKMECWVFHFSIIPTFHYQITKAAQK